MRPLKKYRVETPRGAYDAEAPDALAVWHAFPDATSVTEVKSLWDRLKRYFRFEIR
jgi:hypothetical protein